MHTQSGLGDVETEVLTEDTAEEAGNGRSVDQGAAEAKLTASEEEAVQLTGADSMEKEKAE
jgi:hypothetical protein